jgi:hypothetical protein
MKCELLMLQEYKYLVRDMPLFQLNKGKIFPLRTNLVVMDPKRIHVGGISLLFKIELQGDFSPWIPYQQISPQ